MFLQRDRLHVTLDLCFWFVSGETPFCFQKCPVHWFQWTFSEGPLGRWLGLEAYTSFPTFYVSLGCVDVWNCSSQSLQSAFIFHAFVWVRQVPPSSSPRMICSCGSAILAGSHINADVTVFLQFQLEGINRNCKRIPFPLLAVFLDYCPFKSVGGWGFGREFSVFKLKHRFLFSFFC